MFEFARKTLFVQTAARPVLLLGCLAVTGCTVASSDAAFQNYKGSRVYAIDAQSFEVLTPPGQEGYQHWCVAADYARHKLGADWSDRIFVQAGLGDGRITDGPTSVEFTLKHIAGEANGGFIRQTNAFDIGDNFSVSIADGFCSPFYSDRNFNF